MEVAIRIQDPSGTVRKDMVITAQDGNTVAELIDILVDAMEWPKETMDGEAIDYEVRKLGEAEPLDPGLAVVSLSLERGDGLVLGPRSRAGDG